MRNKIHVIFLHGVVCSVTTVMSGMVTLHNLPENEITLCEKVLQNKVIESWNLGNSIQSHFSKRHRVPTCLLAYET